MKAEELRKKSKDELNDELMELMREQFNLRMQKATGQMAKPHRVGAVRRDIARVKTVLNELTKSSAA